MGCSFLLLTAWTVAWTSEASILSALCWSSSTSASFHRHGEHVRRWILMHCKTKEVSADKDLHISFKEEYNTMVVEGKLSFPLLLKAAYYKEAFQKQILVASSCKTSFS